MAGVSNVVTDTDGHMADVDFENSIVSVRQMLDALIDRYFPPSHVNITAAQAKNLIDTDPSVFIVDVRDQSEYCQGHIPDARLSPWNSHVFQGEYDTLLPTQGNILLYCRSGNRSDQAGDFLWDTAWIDSNGNNVVVYNMLGGMDAWTYQTGICIDLTAAITVLKVGAGMKPNGMGMIYDMDGNAKIGTPDSLFILQKVAGLR